MSETPKISLQEALLELTTIDSTTVVDENDKLEGCISFAVTLKSKDKFDRIQIKTRKNFGRILRNLIEQTLDKIDLEKVS